MTVDQKTVEILESNIIRLLNLITKSTMCKCGKQIWFVKNHKTGKDSPITDKALSHFVDCPFAKEFRR